MDYRSRYRSFINSHYLSEGIRITVGLTLPALIGTYAGYQSIGITLSLGASCLIMVDNAGPVHHRKNAMLACNAVIFISALLTGLAASSEILTGLLITVLCFVFSMIGVYGARAGSIGLAGLFVMVLSLEDAGAGWAVLMKALTVLLGGLWYMALSLSLYAFRPYRVAQQALGDCIQATAEYMSLRTGFYSKDPDYDKVYSQLFDKQVDVQEKQNLVRELLFKSRDIVKESTNTGRVILLIFLDMIDLFERVMSSSPDYKLLQSFFGDSGLLESFREELLLMSEELNEAGIAVKSGRAFRLKDHTGETFKAMKDRFAAFRAENLSAGNVEGFIALRNIMETLEDILARLETIEQYSAYDLTESKRDLSTVDYGRFVTHQDIDGKVMMENVSWGSNTFRHAVRVSVATTAGYIISQFIHLGHSYWILLTIVLILKPNYSLTRQRNYDRLLGTVIGAGAGIAILYLVHDRQVIFGFMVVLMVLAYTFMRTRYLLFVMLMTPYILILFYLLNSNHFRAVIADRLIDTAIGSGIAFLANIFVAPAWVQKEFRKHLVEVVKANARYFEEVSCSFVGSEAPLNQYKLARKQAYVALANITDALNRMLTEPKRKQRRPAEFHQFVVLNYMLSSHIATLAAYSRKGKPYPQDKDYSSVIRGIVETFARAEEILRKGADAVEIADAGDGPQILTVQPVGRVTEGPDGTTLANDGLRLMNARVTDMIGRRRAELEEGVLDSEIRQKLVGIKAVNDQFNFISKISEDLLRAAAGMA